jgi:putative peptide zinc metalloprotease protein
MTVSDKTAIEPISRVVRLRPDIEWSPFTSEANTTWVARDPLALQYFQFSPFERTIAQLCDGAHSLADILDLHRRTGITAEWLVHFAQRLDSSGLTVPNQVGIHSRRLWNAQQRHHRVSLLQLIASPLATRVKLFDPTWLLGLLSPIAALIFHPLFVSAWACLLVVVAFLVVLRWLGSPSALSETFRDITADRALAMFITFICVKSLHELGHALACKKWKAECHEIGLLFLVFTPCLYCDTTDSWKLPSPWRRACIAAAGIYVELTIAALAACLWLITLPGSWLHLLAANVMLICSLSTLLVNGNPLLRYDGYYVLSDLWRVPNLHDQSREAARSLAAAWLAGQAVPTDRWDANPRHLALYALAAWIYRHLVVVMIAWVVWRLFVSFGLPLLGIALVLFMLLTTLATTVFGLSQWLGELRRTGSMRVLRLTLVSGILLAGLGLFFYQPWPTYATSRVVATLTQLTPIYADQSGVLTQLVSVGADVPSGGLIARIASPELELELIDARGSVAYLEQRVQQLKARLVDDEQVASELATQLEQLAKERERLRLLEEEYAGLDRFAPHAGVVLSGDRRTDQTMTELAGLQRDKPLLSEEYEGSAVDRGALLAWVGKPGQFEVTAYVVEHDAEILRPGMIGRCRWDCQLGKIYRGTIVSISTEPLREIPESLLGDASMVVRVSPDGTPLPQLPHYEVRVAIDQLPTELSHQSVGTVHFETAPRTWFESCKRIVDQQVRPEL